MREDSNPPPIDNLCASGELINERYAVLDLLGWGGMGVVYKVRDTVLGEELALKILLPHFVTDEAVIERFINEVRITRKITHPNIVRVHDIGLMGDSLFISMEYVDGESLRKVLDRRGAGARLSMRQSVYIISQLCLALKYAHHYTIHRDIKPDNIMVTQKNRIKLMDFGIAKLKDARYDSNADAIVGTPYYMAPEQLQHAPDVDGRADIYSLGVVLHELVTGRLPSLIPESLSRQYDDVSPELERIIFKCLEHDRENRFDSVVQLRDALRSLTESFHDGSEPGLALTHQASSGVITPFQDIVNVAGALESFLKEEKFSGEGLGEFSGNNGNASVEAGPDTTPYPPLDFRDITPLPGFSTEHHPGRANTLKSRNTSARLRIAAMAGAAAVFLGLLLVVYAGTDLFKTEPLAQIQEAPSPDAQVNLERVQAMLKATGSLVDALQLSLGEYKRENTPENETMVEMIRQMFVKEVESRIYANPFSMQKLNSASTDAVRAGHMDSSVTIRQLSDLVNREVAQFKFVLVGIDTGKHLATFRLNNAYSSKDTEEVTVGDLLQQRFRVVGIGVRSVYLEDTNPKCGRRALIARIMEPVAAE